MRAASLLAPFEWRLPAGRGGRILAPALFSQPRRLGRGARTTIAAHPQGWGCRAAAPLAESHVSKPGLAAARALAEDSRREATPQALLELRTPAELPVSLPFPLTHLAVRVDASGQRRELRRSRRSARKEVAAKCPEGGGVGVLMSSRKSRKQECSPFSCLACASRRFAASPTWRSRCAREQRLPSCCS